MPLVTWPPAQLQGPGDVGMDEPRPPIVAFAGIVVGLFAAGTLPLMPWLVDMDGYHRSAAVAHVLVCAVGAAVALHRQMRPLLLIASVFPYCWLVVPSIYQISHGAAAWGDPGVTLDFSATLRAQAVLLLGQSAVLMVYLAASAWSRRPRRVSWHIESHGRQRMLLLAGVLAVGALLMVPFVASSVGGFGALFTSRSEFNQALQSEGLQSGDKATRALVKTVPSSLATSAVVLALWLVRNSPRGDVIRRWAIVISLGTLPILFVVANPYAFSRYLVLAAFGTVAMAYFRPRTRAAGILWLVGALAAFLLAYPAAETFRRDAPSASTGPFLASKDYDGFQQAINTVTYVDVNGITYGSHVVSGLLFFVPRAIWSGKAEPAAIPVAAERGYNFQNLSMPLPAEAYLDLGWTGVLVLLGLLGVLYARLDRAWLEQSRFAMVAVYLAVAQVGLWRGPFGSLAPVFGFTIGLLLVAIVISGMSSRRTPPGESTRAQTD